MTAKRRKKLQALQATLPVPKVYGPPEGNVLLVGWGSTQGPIREAVDRARAAGDSVSSLHIKHLNPLPHGLENIFSGFHHVFVVEMNDEGFYGYGQLAGLLRARYCDPEDPGHQQDRRPDVEGEGNPRSGETQVVLERPRRQNRLIHKAHKVL